MGFIDFKFCQFSSIILKTMDFKYSIIFSPIVRATCINDSKC